ncbi:MAG: hypothetical protein ABL962_08460, partial [Fimbriimonadaceae bacterium]
MKNLTILIVLTAAFALSGCSGKESTTYINADGTKGTVTADSKDGSMKIESNGTTASVGGGTTVSEADMGMPFYPGSSEKPNSSMKVDAATEKSYLCVRLTSDDVQKVKDFYESKVKGLKFNTFDTAEQTNAMATTTLENGAKIAVTVSRKKSGSETEISMGYGL